MQYRTSSYAEDVFDYFYFEKNLQGDIIAVYNASGTKLVTYKYDAWGNHTATYSNGGGSTGAQYNPFRYRGYYYDIELELYYLNSRYYDSNTGRFISPDSFDILTVTPDQLTDKNLYAYCDNNPITRKDGDGECWFFIGLGIGILTQYLTDVVSNIIAGETGGDIFKPRSSVVDYIAAAAGGVLAASNISIGWSRFANAVNDGFAYWANQTIEGNDVDLKKMFITVAFSAGSASKGLGFKNMHNTYKSYKIALNSAKSTMDVALQRSQVIDIKIALKGEFMSRLKGILKSGHKSGWKRILGIN